MIEIIALIAVVVAGAGFGVFANRQLMRISYRRRVSPEKIERTIENELEQLLLEYTREKEKEARITRAAHPAGKGRRAGRGIDKNTKEIIANMYRPDNSKPAPKTNEWYKPQPPGNEWPPPKKG